MRNLERNKQAFLYKLCTGTLAPVLDPDGFETGEYAPVYSGKLQGRAFISPATGEAKDMAFGTDVIYDRVIVAMTDFGMDENSLLWVDNLESDNPDYIVKRVARSLNNVRIAIARVNANEHTD